MKISGCIFPHSILQAKFSQSCFYPLMDYTKHQRGPALTAKSSTEIKAWNTVCSKWWLLRKTIFINLALHFKTDPIIHKTHGTEVTWCWSCYFSCQKVLGCMKSHRMWWFILSIKTHQIMLCNKRKKEDLF